MIYDKTRALEPGYYDQFEMVYKPALEKDRKDAERYRWLHRQVSHECFTPIAQCVWKRGSDPDEEWVNLVNGADMDAHIDAMLTTEPLLVAPPVTKGKAKSNEHVQTDICGFDRNGSHSMNTYVCDCGWFQHPQLNQCVDDYDLTSNDTRRGD